MSEDDLRVIIFDHQSVPVDPERLAGVARRIAAGAGALGEISIEFVDSLRISELNERYMGKSGPTDVLSFPVDGLVETSRTGLPGGPASPPVVIGEVVLCPEFALKEANDGAQHLDLLVAHGVLHLLGYDHDTEEGAREMRAAEKAATGRVGARAR